MIACLSLRADIIDRIGVVVGDRIIKDSDIERDIRVVSFLNQQKLDLELASRRTAANRLIDQSLIQREIQVGEYQVASESDAAKLARQIETERYHSPAVFRRALMNYGLTEDDLKSYLEWQLTVLRFIDQRFRPAVLVTDEAIQQYYRDHASEFRSGQGPPKRLDEVQDQIRETLTNEGINKQFDSWLRARRQAAKVQYREEELK